MEARKRAMRNGKGQNLGDYIKPEFRGLFVRRGEMFAFLELQQEIARQRVWHRRLRRALKVKLAALTALFRTPAL